MMKGTDWGVKVITRTLGQRPVRAREELCQQVAWSRGGTWTRAAGKLGVKTGSTRRELCGLLGIF